MTAHVRESAENGTNAQAHMQMGEAARGASVRLPPVKHLVLKAHVHAWTSLRPVQPERITTMIFSCGKIKKQIIFQDEYFHLQEVPLVDMTSVTFHLESDILLLFSSLFKCVSVSLCALLVLNLGK